MRVENTVPHAENAEQFVITMATDAFRLCIGSEPRNHSLSDVTTWMQVMSGAACPHCGDRDASQCEEIPCPWRSKPAA